MLQPITQCWSSWETTIKSLVKIIFLSALFSPVNFNMKDGIIIKSTQKRKIPYLIVNILRNSMVILS